MLTTKTASQEAQAQDSVADTARPTPFDESRAEILAEREGNVIKMRPVLPAPDDRLPTDRAGKAPPPATPYWTERAEAQRIEMTERLGRDRIEEAAALLYSDGEIYDQFGEGPYPSVFAHNCLTLATALACAENGLRVVDLYGIDSRGYATGKQENAKIPMGAGWGTRASSDRAEIIKFWQGRGNYPANDKGQCIRYKSLSHPRNLGIATGGDIVGLDLDGKAGLAWLAEHGTDLPKTPKQTTGSGGRHYLFRLPKGETINNTASQIASGVDIRGEGGQLVAGPSIHRTYNFYMWDKGAAPWECEIAEIPAWLMDEAQNASKKAKPRKGTASTGNRRTLEGGGDVRGFEAHLEQIGDGAGGFDGPIYKAACAYFAANGADADATEMMEDLREAILEAPCDDDRNETRYATDEYLADRIEQARDYIGENEHEDEEATQETESESDTGESASTASNAGRKRRQIADDLYTSKHVEGGFIQGDGKKLDKRVSEVRRQIADAMGEMFEFVVMEGGEARALLKADAGQVHRYITKQGLRDMFANRTVAYMKTEKKVVHIHPATEFMTDPLRKTYLGTQFEPNHKKADPLLFNLWTGFAVEPRKGDWSELRNHIRDQIIAGNESEDVSADYLFNWLMTRYAHMFQYPGQKIGSAVVFKGEEGTGKTKFTEWLRRAIGTAAHKIAQRKHLVGNFNGGLDARIYVVSEEAFFSGDKEAAGVVKDMITDDKIEIEKKGYETVTRSNYIRPDFVSNEDWVVPTGENGDARRFLVLHVNNNQKQDKAFFKAIDAQMNEGGVEAMVYDLMHWDPAEYGMEWSDLRNVPWTPARGEQATHGLSGPRARLKAIIELGVIEGRTASGDTFYYNLSEAEETVVARTHLVAALTGGGKAFGGTGKKIQSAIQDMLGMKAACETRKSVDYFETSSATSDPCETVAKTVTFPPLNQLAVTIAERYR